MTVDIRVVRAGQMYRYYLRQTVVGDGRRPARTPLRVAQEQAGVPVGRWMGRGLAVLGLTAGEGVTEAQLRNLFGERGRHPYGPDRCRPARRGRLPQVRQGQGDNAMMVTSDHARAPLPAPTGVSSRPRCTRDLSARLGQEVAGITTAWWSVPPRAHVPLKRI
ncbi:relaxase domain-containing protein [Streptomyces sp. NPDC015501]|uniref:relaxase domain-containing protein n=1 Tax=unclassified Streptomyces TaxID=2593676 RepID=UPI0012844A22|nr:hypothetical protein A3L22_30300 [Streptomyces griseus subsp. griseus]